ncbi:uncharacterized protein LOC104885105 isoform X2 [Beta vulgaris subsp. vulgaris]|uniref:uncharacterized protein LOC104885105 isoform X2 n=1 Tax=Beta vulgaris subsp. vulgaris TaxID=3555 RepID=UPI0020375383|nr:uncharacterized protein LOC104885105 isoform X2 [Beta vulgaris subsp. vulgaris]XP_057248408.1 uncharacterized protein LOC104885105 isoform X2 [Beta vulgaris subsp. vulgaris]
MQGVVWIDDSHEYNEFSAKDKKELSGHYEITHFNGTIRIKSLHFNKYLRRSRDDWIWGDSTSSSNEDPDTLFEVVALEDNAIALRNLGNKKFCKRLSDRGFENCFNAAAPHAEGAAHLVVHEPVSSRIINVQYNLAGARIISQKLVLHRTETANNTGKGKDAELSTTLKYKKSRNTTWSSTTTSRKTATAQMSIKLPKFVDGKIELFDEISKEEYYEKGSFLSVEQEDKYKIYIPPMTKGIIRGYVKEVIYDIPFSSIQTDTYTTAETVEIRVEDGICRGFEAYDTEFRSELIPL